MRNLFWFSGLTVREIATLTRLRPGRVRAILDGEVVPTWPTTFMIVTVMHGSPDDVRWLWEWACGQQPQCPVSRDDAMNRFRAALRGLRLTTEPGTAAWDEPEQRLVHEEQDRPGILDDWEQTRDLVEHFGGSAERFQPLWEQARRAALDAPAFLSHRQKGGSANVE